jgi:hypothetical protein
MGPKLNQIEEITRMTDNQLPAFMPPPGGESPRPMPAGEQGTAEAVKDKASDLTHSSFQSGKHVAGVAQEQASHGAAEAGRQGRDLLRQARDQLGEHAGQGQQRLAAGLLSLSDELRSMADGCRDGGVAAGLAHEAASRVLDAGQWLNTRKPGDVANAVQFFARRKRTVFLVLAAGAGLVAGRLTRGLKDASSGDSRGTSAQRRLQDQHQGAGC